MNKYINRQTAIDLVKKHYRVDNDLLEVIVFEIENSEPEDVQPVRHGHWINHTSEVFPADSTMECSVCHEHESVLLAHDNYCPNCGARMGGEQNETDRCRCND